jgi:hypothetical protein
MPVLVSPFGFTKGFRRGTVSIGFSRRTTSSACLPTTTTATVSLPAEVPGVDSFHVFSHHYASLGVPVVVLL